MECPNLFDRARSIFHPPWLVETPESFVILDAADAWVFLSPAAPIFIWGICTHRWLLLHSCNACVTCPVAGEITMRQAQVSFGEETALIYPWQMVPSDA